MKRNTIKVNNTFIDVTCVNGITRNENNIELKYCNDILTLCFDTKDESNKTFDDILNQCINSKMVLLEDTDGDIISYSNIVTFYEPLFNEHSMIINYQFKNGKKYYTELVYNNYGDNKETAKIKCQQLYDEIFKIWTNNKSKLHKPFKLIEI